MLAILGAEFELHDGYVLINEQQPTARYFFFIMSGEVELSRSGVFLARQAAGTFLVFAHVSPPNLLRHPAQSTSKASHLII